MKVAIITPPIVGHISRGTGIYAQELTAALRKYTTATIINSTFKQVPADYDVYHFPYFDPFFLTLPLTYKNKTIVTVHDLIPIHFPQYFPRGLKGSVKWHLQKKKLRQIDAIITDSYASKVDIEKYAEVNPKRIHVIYLAPGEFSLSKISDKKKINLSQKYSLPNTFALFVGDANWNKNLPNTIRAILQTKIPLVIVNRDFKQNKEVHPWLKSLHTAQTLAKNNPQIIDIGRVEQDELVTLYGLALALLYPSYYEGFGLPVVEAFAAGCPVISSHRGSLKEVAATAAYIVDPDDIKGIAHAINTLHDDLEYRELLIKKGKGFVQRFSWKRTAQETIQVYEQIYQQH